MRLPRLKYVDAAGGTGARMRNDLGDGGGVIKAGRRNAGNPDAGYGGGSGGDGGTGGVNPATPTPGGPGTGHSGTTGGPCGLGAPEKWDH
jgi:hypothetical protein